jgi:glycosyltransferase involved in cell wall biosynthesis
VGIPLIRGNRLGFRTLGWLELNARLFAGACRTARLTGRPRVIYGFSALATPALVATGLCLRRPTISSLFGTFLYPILGRPRSLARNLPEVVAFKAPVTCLQVLDDGTLGDRVMQRLGGNISRLRFWRHGIDWDELARIRRGGAVRRELGLNQNAPLLVSSSRLVDWKRVDRILRVLPHVRDRHPSVVLAIAGDGPERPALLRLAAQLGVSDAVRFLGSLPREKNLQLTAESDVFCSFYDYSNLGVSLIEAMALGVACVVTSSGATEAVVEDGVSGLVVQPDHDNDAADAILTLLDDPDRRRSLGTGARERVRSEYPTIAARAQWELDLVTELSG